MSALRSATMWTSSTEPAVRRARSTATLAAAWARGVKSVAQMIFIFGLPQGFSATATPGGALRTTVLAFAHSLRVAEADVASDERFAANRSRARFESAVFTLPRGACILPRPGRYPWA